MPFSPVAARYSVRAATGVLAAALGAGEPVFAMRNGSTRDVHVYRIAASFACTVSFTAGSQQLFTVDRFDSATHTGGTAETELVHGRSGASTIADARRAGTVGLTDTGVNYDGAAIPLLGMGSPAAASTHQGFDLDLRDDPILLAADQGLAILNAVVWPVAGTGVLTAVVSWWESGS